MITGATCTCKFMYIPGSPSLQRCRTWLRLKKGMEIDRRPHHNIHNAERQ